MLWTAPDAVMVRSLMPPPGCENARSFALSIRLLYSACSFGSSEAACGVEKGGDFLVAELVKRILLTQMQLLGH